MQMQILIQIHVLGMLGASEQLLVTGRGVLPKGVRKGEQVSFTVRPSRAFYERHALARLGHEAFVVQVVYGEQSSEEADGRSGVGSPRVEAGAGARTPRDRNGQPVFESSRARRS